MLKKNFPEYEYLSLDSFDQAVETLPTEGKLLVITSNTFHDGLSDYQSKTSVISRYDKNANLLAQLLKEKNPETKVIVYADSLHDDRYVDDYVMKNGRGGGGAEVVPGSLSKAIRKFL